MIPSVGDPLRTPFTSQIEQKRRYFVLRYAHKNKWPGYVKAVLMANHLLGSGIAAASSLLLAGFSKDKRYLVGVPIGIAFGSFVLPYGLISGIWHKVKKERDHPGV